MVGVAGRPVSMECMTTPPGYPAPQYKWWRTTTPSEILGTQRTLTLQQLRLEDGASYSCQAWRNKSRRRR